jgi:hypothetical protein
MTQRSSRRPCEHRRHRTLPATIEELVGESPSSHRSSSALSNASHGSSDREGDGGGGSPSRHGDGGAEAGRQGDGGGGGSPGRQSDGGDGETEAMVTSRGHGGSCRAQLHVKADSLCDESVHVKSSQGDESVHDARCCDETDWRDAEVRAPSHPALPPNTRPAPSPAFHPRLTSLRSRRDMAMCGMAMRHGGAWHDGRWLGGVGGAAHSSAARDDFARGGAASCRGGHVLKEAVEEGVSGKAGCTNGRVTPSRLCRSRDGPAERRERGPTQRRRRSGASTRESQTLLTLQAGTRRV